MPQTQEAPKFLLLEAIMDLIDEKIDNNQLKVKMEESRASLAEVRKNFDETYSTLDNKIKEGTQREAQFVFKLFTDWENAFQTIEEYFRTGQKFDLVRAGEAVKRCSEVMNLAFDDFEKKSLQVMGPTDIPNLNLLLRTIEEVEQGSPNEKLKFITATEFMVAEGAIKELEIERKVLPFMEQELLIKGYKELQAAIEKVGHYIKDNDKVKLKEGIEELKIVYPKLKELFPLVNYRRMTLKPTKSPSANLLWNMADAFKKGAIPEGMFVEALKDVEQEFSQMQIKFQALMRQETDSILVKEEMEKANEGLTLMNDAIASYYAFLDNREGLFLDQAQWQLKDGVELLDKSKKVFDDISEREGKTPCIRCGTYNQPDRKTCVKCGAILPKAADVTSASTFDVTAGETTFSLDQDVPMPENIEILFTAVNQVSEGEISIEEFEDTVESFQDIMEQNKAAGFAPLPQINIETLKADEKETAKKLLETLKEAKALFEEGYRDFEEGLEYFREYMDMGEKNLLVQGVQIIWEGNKKFHKMDQMTQEMEKYKQQ